MLNKNTLKQFLDNYFNEAKLRDWLSPLDWIRDFQLFIDNLESDESITPSDKIRLEKIIESRHRNVYRTKELFESSNHLAERILRVLSIPTLEEVGTDVNISNFDADTVMNVVIYLRPEEIAKLMCISKEFRNQLRKSPLWREAFSIHFPIDYPRHEHDANIDWLDLFKKYHEKDYQGLSRRTKQLFSAVKSADLFTLSFLDMTYDDLHLEDNREISLNRYVAIHRNKSFRNHIYKTKIRDFYTKHEEDKLRFTLLHQSAAFRNSDLMSKLLTENYDVNIQDDKKRTPLWIAAEYGHLDVVNMLIANRADIHRRSHGKKSPLWIASKNGHPDVVTQLLENQADVHSKSFEEKSPIWVAAENGHHSVVLELLANRYNPSNRANVNSRNYEDYAPIWAASKNGHSNVVKVLCYYRADVNQRNYGVTKPLGVAAENGHVDVVTQLILRGADVNVNSGGYITPLLMAASKGHVDVVRELLANRADMNIADVFFRTPLSVATKNKHTEVVKALCISKLNTVIDELSRLPVINQPATLFGRVFHEKYSKDQKLAAAIALKMAAEKGDLSTLDEHGCREIANNASELNTLYRALRKSGM